MFKNAFLQKQFCRIIGKLEVRSIRWHREAPRSKLGSTRDSTPRGIQRIPSKTTQALAEVPVTAGSGVTALRKTVQGQSLPFQGELRDCPTASQEQLQNQNRAHWEQRGQCPQGHPVTSAVHQSSTPLAWLAQLPVLFRWREVLAAVLGLPRKYLAVKFGIE